MAGITDKIDGKDKDYFLNKIEELTKSVSEHTEFNDLAKEIATEQLRDITNPEIIQERDKTKILIYKEIRSMINYIGVYNMEKHIPVLEELRKILLALD